MGPEASPRPGIGVRCLRALTLAALAWAVAGVAHVAAGGAVPGLSAGAVLVLLTAWPLVALVGSSPSVLRSSASLGVGQAVMHLAMQVGGSHSGNAAAGGSAHGHGSAPLPVAGRPAGTGAAPLELLPDPWMLLAHAAAALALAVLLTHGERGLRAAMELLGAVLTPVTAWARAVLAAACSSGPMIAGRPLPRHRATPRPTCLDVVAHPLVRRGPPLSAA